MHKPNNKSNQGFTIIEVMLVLAIAGLIMLIVFLAVPALQRNSRNTQRKNDVSAILSAFAEAVGNNKATAPASCNGSASACFVRQAKLGYYNNTSTNVRYARQNTAITPPAINNTDQMRIYTYAKCDGNTPTNVNATAKSVVALYAVETANGTSPQCQEG